MQGREARQATSKRSGQNMRKVMFIRRKRDIILKGLSVHLWHPAAGVAIRLRVGAWGPIECKGANEKQLLLLLRYCDTSLRGDGAATHDLDVLAKDPSVFLSSFGPGGRQALRFQPRNHQK